MNSLLVNRDVRESTRRPFQRGERFPKHTRKNSPVFQTGCPHANNIGSPSVRPPYAVCHTLSGTSLASSNRYHDVEDFACWPAKLCALPALQLCAWSFHLSG